MNIIFFGSSKYSTISEKKIYQTFGLSLAVTLPDKLNLRKKEILPNPVKKFAQDHNVPTLTPRAFNEEIIYKIASYKPDFIIVADYGIILPKELLKLPLYSSLNIHQSLLPKYRGPSPAPSAILNGESISGVSIMIMNEKIDSGDILAQKEYQLSPHETTDSLLTELNKLGADLLIPVIKNYKSYFQSRLIQDEKNATQTYFINKQDGFIDLDNPPKPEKLYRMIRAYYPWPSVWTITQINGQKLRLKLIPSGIKKAQKTFNSESILIQLEGKKALPVKDFLNGHPEIKQLLKQLFGDHFFSG